MMFSDINIIQSLAVFCSIYAFFKLESMLENIFKIDDTENEIEFVERKSLKIFKITVHILCVVGVLEYNFVKNYERVSIFV